MEKAIRLTIVLGRVVVLCELQFVRVIEHGLFRVLKYSLLLSMHRQVLLEMGKVSHLMCSIVMGLLKIKAAQLVR